MWRLFAIKSDRFFQFGVFILLSLCNILHTVIGTGPVRADRKRISQDIKKAVKPGIDHSSRFFTVSLRFSGNLVLFTSVTFCLLYLSRGNHRVIGGFGPEISRKQQRIAFALAEARQPAVLV